jgi:hypothetical protein
MRRYAVAHTILAASLIICLPGSFPATAEPTHVSLPATPAGEPYRESRPQSPGEVIILDFHSFTGNGTSSIIPRKN